MYFTWNLSEIKKKIRRFQEKHRLNLFIIKTVLDIIKIEFRSISDEFRQNSGDY